jgi:hypothetical protein
MMGRSSRAAMASFGRTPDLPLRLILMLAAVPLAGGAGLVTYVLSGISLPLAEGTLLALGILWWAAMVSRVSASARAHLRQRLRIGVRAGIFATVAYDSARYGLVSLFGLSFQPFHVFSIFGRLFVGNDAPYGLALAMGIAYHAANGIGFGIAYTLVVRRGSLASGIVWGICLELSMAMLYPSWLRIVALREFLAVSAFGHVIYGAVLGTVVSRHAPRPVPHEGAT